MGHPETTGEEDENDMAVADSLCPGCFGERSRTPVCPQCGFDERQRPSHLALPPRTVLASQYVVGRVLGRPGGFGVTYLGWDLRLETRVAIKEYLPRDMAGRDPDHRSVALHADEDTASFRYGLDQFLLEARTLAKFNHPRVVRVRTFFEENGTAYLVMDYVDGVSLAEHLDRAGGVLTEAQALAIMMPILDGLREIHRRGFLHRDIKPQNIYLTTDGSPILLDFGAARLALGERSRSLSVVLTPGFAPFEQYHRRGEQGPWTDIYACAATLYTLVTGRTPPDALEREKDDSLPAPRTVRSGLSPAFSAALVKAMSTDPHHRPASVEEFQALLRSRSAAPETESLAETVNFTEPVPPEMPCAAKLAQTTAAPRGRRILGLHPAAAAAVLAALLVMAAAGTVIFLGSRPGVNGDQQAAAVVPEGGVPASIPTHPEPAGAQPPAGPAEKSTVPASSGSPGGPISLLTKPSSPPATGKNAPPTAGSATVKTGETMPSADTGTGAGIRQAASRVRSSVIRRRKDGGPGGPGRRPAGATGDQRARAAGQVHPGRPAGLPALPGPLGRAGDRQDAGDAGRDRPGGRGEVRRGQPPADAAQRGRHPQVHFFPHRGGRQARPRHRHPHRRLPAAPAGAELRR